MGYRLPSKHPGDGQNEKLCSLFAEAVIRAEVIWEPDTPKSDHPSQIKNSDPVLASAPLSFHKGITKYEHRLLA